MGFVIWYQVVFPTGGPGGLLPLRVSNDVLSGEFVLDADIKLDMTAGVTVSWFDIGLYDLPSTVVDTLAGLERSGPLPVDVSLGYFDSPQTQRAPAMSGLVHTITSAVDSQGRLVTRVRGFEKAGYHLLTTAYQNDAGGEVRLDEFARKLGDDAVNVVPGSDLATTKNVTVTARTRLEALRQVAAIAAAPVVIADGEVRIGDSVGAQPGITFSPATNIVTLERHQLQVEEVAPAQEAASNALAAAAASAFGVSSGGADVQNLLQLTVLGDPTLRPGQAVDYKPRNPIDGLPGDLRIEHVRHVYSSKSGYTCEARLLSAGAGDKASRLVGARGLAQRIRDIADNSPADRPAVDVGEVQSYQSERHVTTLHYGQNPPAGMVAPSVDADVTRKPLLHDKPAIAPFAWHNTGLMVPVYPAMRAVLAHNRSLPNDALVAGFVWADQAGHVPPRNQRGDWWLCLPTGLGPDGLPSGKGVNDLTDAAGMRVIQAKGLRVTVGEQTLPPVGDRPDVPAAGKLVIEHEKGTKVSVDADGAVTISTNGKDITFTNGQASITLSGGSVKLKGTAVEVSS
jgi:hypothetical protein